jgi:hypothetical protein
MAQTFVNLEASQRNGNSLREAVTIVSGLKHFEIRPSGTVCQLRMETDDTHAVDLDGPKRGQLVAPKLPRRHSTTASQRPDRSKPA